MPDWQPATEVRNAVVTLCMLAILPASAVAQFSALGGRTAGAQVLVIGTYHMNNPGLDPVNVRADDVLGAEATTRD